MPFLKCPESSSLLSRMNDSAAEVNELQSKSLAMPATPAYVLNPLVVILAGHTGLCLELE